MKHKYMYEGKCIAIIESNDILAHVAGTVHTINDREYMITKALFSVMDDMYIIEVIDYK